MGAHTRASVTANPLQLLGQRQAIEDSRVNEGFQRFSEGVRGGKGGLPLVRALALLEQFVLPPLGPVDDEVVALLPRAAGSSANAERAEDFRVLLAIHPLQEVKNALFSPSQEKFHTVIVKGARSIPDPRGNPPMKFHR